jgi:hypothetical protein
MLRRKIRLDDLGVDGNPASLTQQFPPSIEGWGVEAKMIIGEQQSTLIWWRRSPRRDIGLID